MQPVPGALSRRLAGGWDDGPIGRFHHDSRCDWCAERAISDRKYPGRRQRDDDYRHRWNRRQSPQKDLLDSRTRLDTSAGAGRAHRSFHRSSRRNAAQWSRPAGRSLRHTASIRHFLSKYKESQNPPGQGKRRFRRSRKVYSDVSKSKSRQLVSQCGCGKMRVNS